MRLFCSLCFFAALAGFIPSFSSAANVLESPVAITMGAFRQVDCMDEHRYGYYKEIIKSLSYTKMRALRAFCHLENIYAEEAIEALQRLVFQDISFDQVRFLEAFTELDGANGAKSWQLIEQINGLDFTAMQTVTKLTAIDGIDADDVLKLIDTVKRLDSYGHWAAAALFSVEEVDRQSARAALKLIGAMRPEQKMSAEKLFQIDTMDAETIMAVLPKISTLRDADSMNSKALFGLDSISPADAQFWTDRYFSADKVRQEEMFYRRPAEQRSTLLEAFDEAAGYHIRIINDLHAVTRNDGSEISTGALVHGGAALIEKQFGQLHPRARQRFQAPLDQALAQKNIYQAIEILKQATAYARKQTAEDLSTANIFILLSRGSELFDSSFRDILVPILLSRIGSRFDNDLLLFLRQTDPLNAHVSDFIISCAQKGKLTAFFPEQSGEQRAVIDLMARSAFEDEQSLILFSATFATLLEKLQPGARTYLLDKMVAAISDPASVFALQLRVILQFYHDRHPELLSAADRQLIGRLIRDYGSINLDVYTRTDFRRWKADGRLSSLSVFQDDDDGRLSYLSYSRNLLNNGYRLRLSGTIQLLEPDSPTALQARQLIAQGKTSAIYRLSADTPLIVEYYKTIRDIELSHAVAVYQDPASQQRLLEQFLLSGIEMFAQRGHSYWREEQLLEPMQELIENRKISSDSIPDINRFLSIGSCGGIRIYSELNRLFDNTIDIFATVGTGKAIVNDPYNRRLFEIIATSPDTISWDDVSLMLTPIFSDGRGGDYLQPGSLPAILHKMMDTRS